MSNLAMMMGLGSAAGDNRPNFIWSVDYNLDTTYAYQLDPDTLDVLSYGDVSQSGYKYRVDTGADAAAADAEGNLWILCRNASNIYYVTKINRDYSTAGVYSLGTTTLSGLTSDDNYVYCLKYNTDTIYRWPSTGGDPTSPDTITVSGFSSRQRFTLMIEEQNILISGGRNTSSTDYIYAIDMTSGSETLLSNSVSASGGFLPGDYIPSSDLIITNSQYNGDTNYRATLGSTGLTSLTSINDANSYVYGGVKYLESLGVGLSLSYYNTGTNTIITSTGGNGGTFLYSDVDSTIGSGTQRGTANPISKNFIITATVTDAYNAAGQDLVILETTGSTPTVKAKTSSGWQTPRGGSGVSQIIAHSTPPTHRQRS